MSNLFFSRSFELLSVSSQANNYVCRSCRRAVATYRRTRKALRVKVDESFAPSKTENQDHIIFNPPSSAPNVYHTPPKFLPKSDPRRSLYQTSPSQSTTPVSALASIAASRLGSSSSTPASQLPPVRTPYEKKYHLGQEQIDEIRRLRHEDPRTWTRSKLAEKFDCSPFFVGLCCSAPEMKSEQDQRLEEVKKRWGRRKREAREDRQTRKQLWGQDA